MKKESVAEQVPVLSSIRTKISSTVPVIVYAVAGTIAAVSAAASAAAGYIVKKSMDCIAKRLTDYFNKQKESR